MVRSDLLALALIPAGILATATVVSLSRRARDAAFCLLVFGVTISTFLDINFLSQEWYRGTTRGIEFSFVDILSISLLVSLVLFPRPGQARFYWPASLGIILLFLLYCLVSVAASTPKLFGVFEFTKLIRALICFLVAALFIQSERELRLCLWALIATVAFEGVLAVKQRYLDGVYRVGGTLDHPNSLSIYLLLTGPVLVAVLNSAVSKTMRYAAAGAIGLATIASVLTASRMGIPAYALVMGGATLACISYKITLRKIAITFVIFASVAGMMVKAWDIVISRYGEASLEEEYQEGGKENRGHYLRLAEAVVKDRFFGVGLNNWSYWISKKYGPELGFEYEDYDDIPESMLKSSLEFDWAFKYAPPAHNLAAITAGELGIPGLVLFTLMLARWFWMALTFLWPRSPDPSRRIGAGLFFGLMGVFLQSLTEWVFRQTGIMLAIFLLMGVLAALRRLKSRLRLAPHEPLIEARDQAFRSFMQPEAYAGSPSSPKI